eukprot:IDg12238t1
MQDSWHALSRQNNVPIICIPGIRADLREGFCKFPCQRMQGKTERSMPRRSPCRVPVLLST